MKTLLALLLLLFTSPATAQVILDGTTEAYSDRTATAEYMAARLNYYSKVMGLDHWRIYVSIEYELEEDPGTTATTYAAPEYLSGQITFYMDAFLNQLPEVQEEIYRHELFHLLLWPIGNTLAMRFCCSGEPWNIMLMLRESRPS